VRGGDGRNAGLIGNGGAGGAVKGLSAAAALIGGDILVNTGEGGAGGNDQGVDQGSGDGGAGGELSGLNIAVGREVLGIIELETGTGGNSTEANPAGAGGAASNIKVRVGTASDFSISTGGGGMAGLGTGGAGGAIDSVSANFGAILGDDVIVDAGDGGAATGAGAVGGLGGAVNGINVSVKAGLMDDIRVSSGIGGGSNGVGAAGGDLSSTKLALGAGLVVDSLTINTGRGGNSDASTGGNGGKLGGVTVTSGAH